MLIGREKSYSDPIYTLTPSEPALAAAVGLDVAEALAAAGGKAEVELLDVLVLGERAALAVHHHAPVLQDVAVARVAQRDVGVLLRDLEDLLDELRREPHRGLIQQDHPRPRHERAPDRGHLLLAARGVAGERAA